MSDAEKWHAVGRASEAEIHETRVRVRARASERERERWRASERWGSDESNGAPSATTGTSWSSRLLYQWVCVPRLSMLSIGARCLVVLEGRGSRIMV